MLLCWCCGAVAGLHMTQEHMQKFVHDAAPHCGSDESKLHCYVVDDGALLLYSNEFYGDDHNDHNVSATAHRIYA